MKYAIDKYSILVLYIHCWFIQFPIKAKKTVWYNTPFFEQLTKWHFSIEQNFSFYFRIYRFLLIHVVYSWIIFYHLSLSDCNTFLFIVELAQVYFAKFLGVSLKRYWLSSSARSKTKTKITKLCDYDYCVCYIYVT